MEWSQTIKRKRYVALMVAGVVILLGVFAFSMVALKSFVSQRSVEWQDVTFNDIQVYLPRVDNGQTSVTAGDPPRLEWYIDGDKFMLEGTAVYWNDTYFGHCEENGTVRVYPDGKIEIDGEHREPIEE